MGRKFHCDRANLQAMRRIRIIRAIRGLKTYGLDTIWTVS